MKLHTHLVQVWKSPPLGILYPLLSPLHGGKPYVLVEQTLARLHKFGCDSIGVHANCDGRVQALHRCAEQFLLAGASSRRRTGSGAGGQHLHASGEVCNIAGDAAIAREPDSPRRGGCLVVHLGLTGAYPAGCWLRPASPGEKPRLAVLHWGELAGGPANLRDLSRPDVLKC